MHFSTLTLAAAVTASCLLSSAWSLPDRSRSRVLAESSQTALLTSPGPALDSPPGNAAFVQQGLEPGPGRQHAPAPNRHRFRVQKRSSEAEFDARKVALAQERAILNLFNPKKEVSRPMLLSIKAACERRHGFGEPALAPAPPSTSAEGSQQTTKASEESDPLMYARHRVEKTARALLRFRPARMLPGGWGGSRVHRPATEERGAAAMRPVAQGFNTLRQDLGWERGW
ncbi:MAG: hypothetical protein M1826_000472 [Phylliscum demangeonii]|nr:MAG: hypothetical protein M1826_000472 [Phylliscum demangeonii]